MFFKGILLFYPPGELKFGGKKISRTNLVSVASGFIEVTPPKGNLPFQSHKEKLCFSPLLCPQYFLEDLGPRGTRDTKL